METMFVTDRRRRKRVPANGIDAAQQLDALRLFNELVRGANTYRGHDLRARMTAVRSLVGNTKERDTPRVLFEFLRYRFPHWGFSREFSEENLVGILAKMSTRHWTDLVMIERGGMNPLLRFAVSAYSAQGVMPTPLSVADMPIEKGGSCVVHSDRPSVSIPYMAFTGEFLSLCSGCKISLGAAFKSGGLDERSFPAEVLRYLRDQMYPHIRPSFKKARVHIGPEKTATVALKERAGCQIHPDRPVAKAFRMSSINLALCRGCLICLGSAFKRGRLKGDADVREIEVYLSDRLTGPS